MNHLRQFYKVLQILKQGPKEDVLPLKAAKHVSRKLLWVDLEMGGLDEKVQPIIEVAMIVTKGPFEMIDQFHAVIYQSPEAIDKMEAEAREMHLKNGLLERLPKGEAKDQVQQKMLRFVEPHFGKEKIILAGNSIHRDVAFLKIEMPEFAARLHHRLLDVTAWKIYFQLAYGKEIDKSSPHLAMKDVELSIQELKSYSQYLIPPV